MCNQHSSNYEYRLIIPALTLSAVYIISGLMPIESLWGFNFLKYYPQYVSGIYALLFLLFVLPFVADKIIIVLYKLSYHFQKLPKPIRIIIISIIAGAIFYALRVHVHSLGDGYQRVFEIEKGLLHYPTEPLDFFFHATLYRLIILFGTNSAELSYVIISVVSGIFLINAIYLFEFPKQIESTTAILIKILIIASGGLQIYFGYVESYSLYYMFSLLFFLYATKYLMSGQGLITAAIMLSLAIVSHITASFLLPGFAYLVYLNVRDSEQKSFKEKYLAPLFVGSVILGLIAQEIILQYVRVVTATPYSGLFLPLFSTSEYAVFSPQHLYDVLNQFLLITPFSILVIVFIGSPKNWISAKNKLSIFLLILVIGALLSILLVDPKLGYARDWDLFSTPTAILSLSLCFLSIFKRNYKSISKYSAFVIGSISILFLSGWILTNSSEQKQLNRAHDLLSLSDKGLQYCTELLAYYYRHEKKDNQKAIELYQTIGDFEGNARLNKKMGDAQKDLGYYKDAEKSYMNALIAEPENPSLLNKIGQVLIKLNKYDTAIVFLNKAHRLEPDTTSIIETLALAYIHKNEYDKANLLADTLFLNDSHSAGATLIKLTIASRQGDWQTARLFYLDFLKHGQTRSDYKKMREYYKNLQ